MAEGVMGARQSGVSMAQAMEISDNKGDDFTPLFHMIVKDAYSHHRYFTQEYRDKEITEFGVEHYLNCLKSQE